MSDELFEYSQSEELTDEDRDAIRATCLDYIVGWYDRDAERMRRSLHPNLAKHTLIRRTKDGEPDTFDLPTRTAESLVEITEGGEPQPADDRRADVTILSGSYHLASAEVISAEMVDLLHLVRLPDGWKIIHALWTILGGGIMTAED